MKVITLNKYQSELVQFIVRNKDESSTVDLILNTGSSRPLSVLRKLCDSQQAYSIAKEMYTRQSREVLEAVMNTLHNTRRSAQCPPKTDTEIRQEHHVTATECIQSRIASKQEIMTKFYGGPKNMNIFLEPQFFKSTNVRGKATMNTETLNLVKGRDVRELSEGKLIDIQNDVKEEVTHNENSIVALQERLRVAKEKLTTLKTDIKVIGEHIKDKRNQNKLDS